MKTMMIAAYTLSSLAALLMLLVFLAGSKPNILDNVAFFKVDVGSLKVPTKLSTSQFLADIEQLSHNKQLTGGGQAGAKDLNLAQFYTVHAYSACSHAFSGAVSCTAGAVGTFFNPNETLKLENTGLPRDFFAGDYNDVLGFYRRSSFFGGLGFILGFALVVLAPLMMALRARVGFLGLLGVVATWLGSIFLLSDSAAVLAVSNRIVDALEHDKGVGIKASLGSEIALPFVATFLSIVASVLYSMQLHRGPAAGAGASARQPRAGSSDKRDLLGRFSVWPGRSKYVEVEKQPAIQLTALNGPGNTATPLMEAGEEAPTRAWGDYGGPKRESKDIAYEPYSSQYDRNRMTPSPELNTAPAYTDSAPAAAYDPPHRVPTPEDRK